MKTISRKNTVNVSVSLSRENTEVIERLAKQEWSNKSSIVNRALSAYARTRLQSDLRQAYLEDQNENVRFAEETIGAFNEIACK